KTVRSPRSSKTWSRHAVITRGQRASASTVTGTCTARSCDGRCWSDTSGNESIVQARTVKRFNNLIDNRSRQRHAGGSRRAPSSAHEDCVMRWRRLGLTGSHVATIAGAACASVLMLSTPSGQQGAIPSTGSGEWPTYAGDLASTHYSPLDQIDA